MKQLTRLSVLLLTWGACASALAAVTATLDRNQITLGETVQLQLSSDASPDTTPNVDVLRRDFDIVGSSSGSSRQYSNGHWSSQTQLIVMLVPKHDGTIQIPSLQWGGELSAPVQLTVERSNAGTPAGQGGQGGQSGQGGQGGAAQPGAADVFLTTTADQKQPYVQAPVVLTVRLFVGSPLDQASLDFPGSSDVLVKQLGKDARGTEDRNGHSYQVISRKYVLIPQRSGKLSLPGPVLDGQVQVSVGGGGSDLNAFFGNAFGNSPFSRMMTQSRPLHLTSNSVELNVQPRPAGVTGNNWLPAKQVTLEESWRPDSGALHVGDPLTRHLHLSALGVTGSQLPDLSTMMALPDGIKAYPDQAKSDDGGGADSLTGSRDQDVALVASNPGKYTLPALKLTWWDTVHNSEQVAVLPARTLDILPAIGGQAAAPTPGGATTGAVPTGTEQTGPTAIVTAAPADRFPWKWISLAFAVLWLGTLFAWWFTRRHGVAAAPAPVAPIAPTVMTGAAVGAETAVSLAKTPVKPAAVKVNLGTTLGALQAACRDNDPQAARRHLLEWAARHWPENPPAGLNALAQQLGDAKLIAPLQELDRACYTGAPWQGDTLAQLFAAPPAPAAAKQAKPVIPDLYA